MDGDATNSDLHLHPSQPETKVLPAPERLLDISPPFSSSMHQLLRLLTLTLLVVEDALCSPALGRCEMDEAASPICMSNLEQYYAEVTNLPSRLNERSLAAWTYVERIDLDRVPQVIHEAVCLTRHSCNGVDATFGVESIPIAIKMPVLRRNPGCQFYSTDFETVNIACICAAARRI